MQELVRGFEKGKLLGKRQTCQKMIEMEKREPKVKSDEDEDSLRKFHIQGLEMALTHLYS